MAVLAMAGENLVFPWARLFNAAQLAEFVEDLWGAASGDNDFVTLDAIEQAIAKHRPQSPCESVSRPCPLSPRHLRVLARIANGDTHDIAARRLSLRRSTIRALLAEIFQETGAQNAAHAAVIAVHYGWLPAHELELPPRRKRPWRWERKTPQAWKALYHEHALAAHAQPGEWLSIDSPYKTFVNAERAAGRIRKAHIDDFRPAGSFAAEAFLDDGEWLVRIRYVGTTPTISPGSTS